MDNSFWNLLTGFGTKIYMEKNVILGGKNSDAITSFVYLLEEGICALTSFTKQGEEKVYLYFRPKRIICFNQLVISPKRRDMAGPEFSIITKTPCALYRISVDTFEKLLLHNQNFNAFLMETLADNYDEALVHFHLMQEESAAVRLCRLLLEVSEEKSGVRLIPKFFTYAELAKYLGIHPVTVSRIMAKLKQRGCISRSSGCITIEQEAQLKGLIGAESCFKY